MGLVIIIILGVVGLIFFLKKKNGQATDYNSVTPENVNGARQVFNSSKKFPYPDRSRDIVFLQGLLERAVENKDYETANLNFAKLIEAMRQQNINMDNALTIVLEDSKRLFAEFRKEHNLTYPGNFAQNIEGESNSDPDTEYSELLKRATAQSADNMDEAIAIIKKAIELKPNEFQGHKKLAGYLQSAGRFNEAVILLNELLKTISDYEKSQVFDYLAVLYKKEKNDIEAMKLESYSIYFYTMLTGPIAYRTPSDFIDSIRFKRKYKPKELADNFDNKMKDFWGQDWLTEYHKKYLDASDKDYKQDRLLKKLKTLTGDKTFEKYKEFIKELS